MEAFVLFLQKSPFNMMLFGAAVATGLMLLWPLVLRPFRAGSEISAFEAVQLINRQDALVLDVRDTGEFEAGHITNAKHLPERQLGERLKELEKFKGRPIVVTCRSGARAGAAVDLLRKNGFAAAVTLRGGLGAWREAGMPVDKK